MYVLAAYPLEFPQRRRKLEVLQVVENIARDGEVEAVGFER